MTAHELARKLLAGGDYTVAVGHQVSEYAALDFNVQSMNGLVNDTPHTTPVIVLTVDRHSAEAEVFPYTRSQVG